MGNRSLDDFLDDGTADPAQTADADSAPVDDADGAEGADEPAAAGTGNPVERDDSAAAGADETGAPATSTVKPAVSTYVARPGECAACGATAERRWQGEDGPVCPDCKDW